MSEEWHNLDAQFEREFLWETYGVHLAHEIATQLRDQLGISRVSEAPVPGGLRSVFYDEYNQIIKLNPPGSRRDNSLKHGHKNAPAVDDFLLKPITIMDVTGKENRTKIEIFPKLVSGFYGKIGVDYSAGSSAEDVFRNELLKQGFYISDLGVKNLGFVSLPKDKAATLPSSRRYKTSNGIELLAHNNLPIAFCIDSGLLYRDEQVSTELVNPSMIYYPSIQEEFIPQLRTKIPLPKETPHNLRLDIEHHYVVASGSNWQTRINDERINEPNTNNLAK